MKVKVIVGFASVFLLVLLIAALSGQCRRAYVLRLADTVDLHVAFAADGATAVVSGGMTHSGLMVTHTAVRRSGKQQISRVYIAPIKGVGGIGSYRMVVPLPPGVNEIWFGDPAGKLTVATFFGSAVQIPTFRNDSYGGVIWRRPMSSAVRTPG
jgi:hypothetical protein